MNPGSGDLQAKLSVIRRIKRLSLMPLPVSRYVDVIFDLVSQVIPNSDIKVMVLDKFGTKFIWRNVDFSRYAPLYSRCFTMSFKEVGVIAPSVAALANKTVLSFEEIIHPDYDNSYIYNEIYKTQDIYYIMLAVLKNGFECVGQFPLFRSKNMCAFNKEDFLFMESIAPYVAYGISKSKSIDESFNAGINSGISSFKSQAKGIGLILINKKGEIMNLNDAAKNMFFQSGLLDGLGIESMEQGRIGKLLCYINAVIRTMFLNGYADNINILPEKVYTSPSGIDILMKGYCMEGICGDSNLVAITCEEVVPDYFMQLKKRMLYNLSEKELEICNLLKEGYKPAEIEEMLHITRNTLKTHTANILSKLGVGGINEIRTFARGI